MVIERKLSHHRQLSSEYTLPFLQHLDRSLEGKSLLQHKISTVYLTCHPLNRLLESVKPKKQMYFLLQALLLSTWLLSSTVDCRTIGKEQQMHRTHVRRIHRRSPHAEPDPDPEVGSHNLTLFYAEIDQKVDNLAKLIYLEPNVRH